MPGLSPRCDGSGSGLLPGMKALKEVDAAVDQDLLLVKNNIGRVSL
jgi:hypothetical protein